MTDQTTTEAPGRLSADREAEIRAQVAPGLDPWISPGEVSDLLAELDHVRAETARLTEQVAAAEQSRDSWRSVAEGLDDDRFAVLRRAQQAEADLAATRSREAALREALTMIRTQYGRVCADYMECSHTACESSYGAWATADEALSAAASPATPRTYPDRCCRGKAVCDHDTEPPASSAAQRGEGE